MRFELATAGRIVFGPGAVREVAPAAKELGGRALVVTGRSRERAAPVEGLASAWLAVPGEPTVELVREGLCAARQAGCGMVIAIGGGSAIDAGKAIAALLSNGGDPLDYLEVIGGGKPLLRASAPFIAIPTTAGTGAEVTRNAVLASPEQGVKASLRSAFMLPRMAVVDPELTLGLSPAVTACTGLDALTQLIEPFVSPRANPMTDLFCLEGMRRATGALRRAYADGADRAARESMAYASLLGGLALANAGLGAVHGFAAPIGGMFPAPHGGACAALLPHVMEANIRALRERAPESQALGRYETVARVLTGSAAARAEDGAEWAGELCRTLAIPPLARYGAGEADVDTLVEKAAKSSSMKGNPVALTGDELRGILRRAM